MSAKAKLKVDSHAVHDEHYLVTMFSDSGAPSGKPSRSKKAGANLDVLKTEVWDTTAPIGLGHPYQWSLERTEKGVRLRRLDATLDTVISDACQEFALGALEDEIIPLVGKNGRMWLKVTPSIGLPSKPLSKESAPELVAAEDVSELAHEKTFKMISIGVFIGVMVLGCVLSLLPKPKVDPEEVIPAQFAKILLSPAVKPDNQGASAAQGGAEAAGPKRNVVQAFKSEAVQKSVKKLLNVSALTALSKSNLLSGVGSKATLDQVFSGKASKMAQFDSKALDPKSAEVGMIGGKGGKGGGTGYGTGSGASLTGQGNAQVDIGVEGLSVAEGLSKEEVGKAIRKHLGDIRYCYESALVRNPGVEGKLVAAFVIMANGRVKTAEAKESTSDAGLNKCILGKLMTWEFPKPKGGVTVGVSYPFIFKSLGN